MALHFTRIVNGKVVRSDRAGGTSLARADYPTSSDCATCGRSFDYAPRRRALRYCGAPCRLTGRHKTLRRAGRPYIGPGGYRYVLTADGWRGEHLVVMEQVLQRPLRSTEHVEHLDGARSNNERSNLALRSTRVSKAEHGALPYGK